MIEPAIELNCVTIKLGTRCVLDNISFTVNKGEFIGLLGPNGSGKTTLMRTLLGLSPIAHGRLRVLKNRVTFGNTAIGYMPQVRNTAIAQRLSGRDFIACAFNGNRLGVTLSRSRKRRTVDDVLAIVGASTLAERPFVELSGGERQRLLLAQCLLGQPKLLLLDEPLISLDPNHQASVVELVRRVQRQLGITILFSAHELNPLLNVIDRVLYLGNSLAVLGTVDQVITPSVLSRLYGGVPIDVIRISGRIFVMFGGIEIEQCHHSHNYNSVYV
ncbi:metal ABC transporter ATP-binding protein [Candidatus Vallotia tarda]|uniref:Zinc/manganese transport system ATP-binding protein n=1 Tax=Candidatus Vallotiella hemipterorum TaxID=1177213 RepID=A0A916JSE5_9BURK|nr:ATP-binding cassette domain-containing protein [Candidatus Vallotia tarda]CAG7597481.1 Zinc/manganese transport system ATP-binding protein [Candidatus Vallotia tarda]